jgi:cytoskeletal protein CcmA (bactofilin family)
MRSSATAILHGDKAHRDLLIKAAEAFIAGKTAPKKPKLTRLRSWLRYAPQVPGDINCCDRLVVEGTVEVSLHGCRELDIASTGLFKGSASIENAEVSGRFEGDLVASKRLLIRASGHVSGRVTYGQIEIERGGKISGSLEVHETKSAVPFLDEPAFARRR